MKKIELIEQEIEVLKKMVSLAVKNGNSINPIPYETSPSDYAIVCDIYNKLFTE